MAKLKHRLATMNTGHHAVCMYTRRMHCIVGQAYNELSIQHHVYIFMQYVDC